MLASPRFVLAGIANIGSRSIGIAICLLASLMASEDGWGQSFRVAQHTDRVDFSENGKPITSYLLKSGSKPILWPLIGPGGARMSREYPMNPAAKNEEHDHVHHRSLWMTFGEVDDVDFWAEGNGKGEILHSKITATESTDRMASIEALHVWQTVGSENTPSKPMLEEQCKYTVSGTEDERIIDCEYVLRHAENAERKPIHFGDTKEGMFAIRVPESMRADRAGGQILNSNGLRNAEAWGQPGDWVDYSGKATPEATEDLGIAILIHPSSFGNKGFWHVRTYGLFAHNPIGVKHFMEGKSPAPSTELPIGGYLLEPNQTMHLFYRVILHRGAWNIEQANRRFSQFTSVPARLQ